MNKKDAQITDKEIELFAHMILPEIKKFFADEKIKAEFEKWQKQENDYTEKDKE